MMPGSAYSPIRRLPIGIMKAYDGAARRINFCLKYFITSFLRIGLA
jgi:hypothetical protein